MSLLPSIFGSDETDDTADIERDGTDTTVDEDGITPAAIPRELDAFAVNQQSFEREGDKMTLMLGDDNEAYAGEWPREMFENSTFNPQQPTWIGYEDARNPLEGVTEVGLLHEELNSHMAIFGASGYGKSTLLLNMMTQWAYAGFGFCFIDPKGDDAYKLMQMLPEHRLDDVYWVEPNSTDFDKSIGMNFLQTHYDSDDDGFESEASQLIGDLIPILKATSTGWGAAMDSIVKNVSRKMLADDKEYNLLDIYFLLNNPEWREDLPEYYEEQPMLLQRAKGIAEMDQTDIEPVLRRFQTFAEDRAAHEVVAREGSNLDAHEIINDNKIIILRTSEVNEDLQKLLATTVMRRLWSVISTREKGDDNTPYFLVADEFGKVAGAGNNVEDMLSRGRSLGLSMTLATQQPSQLDDLQESLGNVKNFISFSPGDEDDARFISGRIGMDSDMLMRLPRYNAYCNLRIDGQTKSGPIRTQTFAPYPSLRTEDEATQAIADIVDRYGQVPPSNEDLKPEINPLRQIEEDLEDPTDSTADGDLYNVTESNHTLTQKELLECIFDAQLQAGDGDPDSFTTKDDVKEQLTLSIDDDDIATEYVAIDHALENIPDGYLDKDLGDEVYMKLTPAGRDRVFSTDSGASGSAGKIAHRVLLEKSYLLFRRLGYDVTVPRQEGRMPDGICKPKSHLNPNTADNYTEAQRRETELADTYPRLYELFGTDELHLEPENSTLDKPKQPFKNLIKALEQGRKCVYVVRDGEADDHDFAHYARRIHNWIDEQKFAKRVDGQDRIFYNFSKTVKIEDDETRVAVRPGDDQYSTWRDKGDKIILESPDDVDKPYAEFDDPSDLDNPPKSKFPFFYKYDPRNQTTTLYNSNGKKLGTYDDKDGIKRDDFTPIPQPFIPERELPEWPLPPDWDGYAIVIIPSDQNPDMGPQLYDVNDEYDTEYIPIFDDEDNVYSLPVETDADEDALSDINMTNDVSTSRPAPTDTTTDTTDNPDLTDLDEDDFTDLDQAIADETTDAATDNRPTPDITDNRDHPNTPSNTDDTPETTPDVDEPIFDTGEDDGTAKNADDVPIADNTSPKSTTDVVKDNDDTWTKPEPGDDDYDPSKDNNNYHTGYNEDYTDEDYTGGHAREQDSPEDIDDYWEDKQRRQEQAKEDARQKWLGNDSNTNTTDHDAESDDQPDSSDNDEHDTPPDSGTDKDLDPYDFNL